MEPGEYERIHQIEKLSDGVCFHPKFDLHTIKTQIRYIIKRDSLQNHVCGEAQEHVNLQKKNK